MREQRVRFVDRRESDDRLVVSTMWVATVRRLALMLIGVICIATASPVAGQSSETTSNASELRLDAGLIEDFLYVIYFADEGRLNFREYATCSYQFLQNPRVSIEDDLLRVEAEYLARRGTEALGGCVGSPATNTGVSMTARLAADGSSLAIEVLEVTTESMPRISGVLLGMAGITVPMTHEFDVMGAMNQVLYDNLSFGVSALEIHEAVVEDGSVLLQMTIKLGIW